MNPFGFLTTIFSPISSMVNTWQNNRAKKQARKDKIAEAQTDAQCTIITKQASGDVDYDIEAQRQMQYSWKDEYLVIIMSLPFIASFIPKIQDYVAVGWTYISAAPDWYQWAFLGIISATFGLRGWMRHKQTTLLMKKTTEN